MCIVCLMLPGCAQAPEEKEEDMIIADLPEESIDYVTAAVSLGDVSRTAWLRCVYAQTTEEEIRASVSGKKVEEVYVSPGDSVTQGQLLAVLTGGDRKAELEELEYQIARNRLLLGYIDANESQELSHRWWTNVYQTAIPEEELEEELEEIRQKYRYQREDYEDIIGLDLLKAEIIREEMEESRLYAGIDGNISHMYQGTLPRGTEVMETEVLIRVVDNTACIFESSQNSYGKYFRENQVVELQMDSGSGQMTVDMVPYDMEHWGEKLYFEVLDKENVDIQAGAGGNLSILVDSRKQVLSIPKNALYTAGTDYYVYVQGQDGLREVRWVETGLVGDDMVEIVHGLSEGERVILK